MELIEIGDRLYNLGTRPPPVADPVGEQRSLLHEVQRPLDCPAIPPTPPEHGPSMNARDAPPRGLPEAGNPTDGPPRVAAEVRARRVAG
ncbi:hypothetical protein GCM10009609_20490 [Pseudonocardia aurantiaca]